MRGCLTVIFRLWCQRRDLESAADYATVAEFVSLPVAANPIGCGSGLMRFPGSRRAVLIIP
jgi:hypothetical protein